VGKALVAVLVAFACASGCSRRDTRFEDHRDAFASLSATTAAIGQNWLRGTVSGTYAVTALDRTYTLVEQERSALTATASMVSDDRGAALADSATMLARQIAQIIVAVRAADGTAARQHLSQLAFRAS
jgi:hypothetical protein